MSFWQDLCSCHLLYLLYGLLRSNIVQVNFDLQDLLTRHMSELESLKLQLRLQNGDSSSWMEQPKSHTPNTIQISTSNLPQLDWEHLAQHPSPPMSYGSDVSQSYASSHPTSTSQSLDLLDSFPAPSMPRQSPAGGIANKVFCDRRAECCLVDAHRYGLTIISKASLVNSSKCMIGNVRYTNATSPLYEPSRQ